MQKYLIKSKKGFVMFETIIVISILAIGLVSLYASYVLIIKKISANEDENPKDTYLAAQLNNYKFYDTTNTISNPYYVEVFNINDVYYVRTCGLNVSSKTYCGTESSLNVEENNLYSTLDIEKIYYFKKKLSEIILNKNVLLDFDGSTINYLQSIKNNENIKDDVNNTIIVKTKNTGNGSNFSYYQKQNNLESKSLRATILGNNNSNVGEVKTIPGREISTVNEAVLAATIDDYGISYYYRGNVQNNYVVFAKMCWRIVRIDGLGNIKLVLYNYNSDKENITNPCASTYDGESNAFARVTGDTYTRAFNSSSDYNAYVGFMYGAPGSSTYEEEHANTNKSTILTYLETWYTNNLASYESKLADVIWCNDKSLGVKQLAGQTGYANTGIGTANTWYGATERLISESSYAASPTASPTLICPDASTNNDNYKNISRYTVDEDEYGGNGALDKPIGLLTADEIAFAGSCYGSSCANSSYYLYKNASSNYWWSASPFYFNSSASEWSVRLDGYLGVNRVNAAYGLRPAVSLKSTTTIVSGGEGTANNPFIVQ